MRILIAAFALIAALNIPNMLNAFGDHMIYEDEVVVASYVQATDDFPTYGAPSDEELLQMAEANVEKFGGEGQLGFMKDMRVYFLMMRLEQAQQIAAAGSTPWS